MNEFKVAVTLGLLMGLPVMAATDLDLDQIDIPHHKFVLENGLTLIVHEDHKAPIVAVNVWYHVGSKNEKAGKTGFAHLFEHLMFNGSENHDDEYFRPLELVGATDLNGTTNRDRTNYFQNVPSSAIDIPLWMESDRMGHLLGVVTQDKLDEQRGVVQNEKRQRENQPYGRAFGIIAENTYPAGHPYSWTTIGSMEDLNAATLEDVHTWFKTYYGAANAVLTVAGDIDPEDVKKKVERYFGDIPAGPPLDRQQAWVTKRSESRRQVLQDRVPQARLYKVWNIPQWGSEAADALDLVSDLLGHGKTSRLHRRLVHRDRVATQAEAYLWLGEIAGQLIVEVTAQPGQDLEPIEKAVDEELQRFLEDGPSEAELSRTKTQYFGRFLRGIERIGGFGGKSDVLARSQVYGGRPDHYKLTLEGIKKLSGASIREFAREWLSAGAYILEVHPFGRYQLSQEGADRSRLPEPGAPPPVRFPELQRAQLSNGLKIILAERHSVPLVQFDLLVDAGYAADFGSQAGTASLTLKMMDEGTNKRSSEQISEELANLGAELDTGSNLDLSFVSLSTLTARMDEALAVYTDVIVNPSFPETEFERLQKQQLATIETEKASPFQMARRVLPRFLYGPEHAYGNPMTGSGTAESVASLSREDLVGFHRTWFLPENATLVVVGDATMDEIRPKLEGLFQHWSSGTVPAKESGKVLGRAASAVYLMDRPGAIQSMIFAGRLAPPKTHPLETAIQTANNILGGSFTSRINMNLREEKNWSYGVRSYVSAARGLRPFMVIAPVQTDKTKEALAEIARELDDVVGSRPVTDQELGRAQKNQVLRLPGSWETLARVRNAIRELVRFELPDDYYLTYPDKVGALSLEDLAQAARQFVRRDEMVWVVVGDRKKVEEGIRSLRLGEVHLIDADGEPVG